MARSLLRKTRNRRRNVHRDSTQGACTRDLKNAVKRYYLERGYKVYRVRQIQTGHLVAYFRGRGPLGLAEVTMNWKTAEKICTQRSK